MTVSLWNWPQDLTESEHSSDSVNNDIQYLLIWRWCWITMFFSWMVSSRAVARDLRSEMDWGVTGKLQPFSSDNNSSFTAHTSVVSYRHRIFNLMVYRNTHMPVLHHHHLKRVLIPLTLFGGEHSGECTAVGFPTDFRVLLALQGTLKSIQSISEDYTVVFLLKTCSFTWICDL